MHCRKKALRGAGAGACWVSTHVFSGLPDGWFYRGKMKEFASGTVSVSDRCPKRLLEVSRRAFASSREAQSGQNGTGVGPIGAPGMPKVRFEAV